MGLPPALLPGAQGATALAGGGRGAGQRVRGPLAFHPGRSRASPPAPWSPGPPVLDETLRLAAAARVV